MFGDNSDSAWKSFGKNDPYFGVYSREEFRTGNLNEDALGSFFESGSKHVGLVLDTIRDHLDSEFKPRRALDFGCGVGRITIPLARVCEHAVGVDVSEDMLEEARRNCSKQSVSNVDLVGSDNRLSKVEGTFDLIHSFVVLQHIPVKRGEALLTIMLDMLEEDGVGVLHFTYHRKSAAIRKIVNYARKKFTPVNGMVNVVQGRDFAYPMMQMNSYNLNEIFHILQANGCGKMYIRPTNHGGYMGVLIFFQKKRQDLWPMDDILDST